MQLHPRILAVVVTHNRAALLARCLSAIAEQELPVDAVLVVDNASSDATASVIARHARAQHLRQTVNLGAAAGYRLGIEAALDAGADFVWLMDDDGRPGDVQCLATLATRAAIEQIEFVAPLVLDVDDPSQLAFPLRIGMRTVFDAATARSMGVLHGFAHLFNGALIGRAVFDRIGLPDPRFVIRGDEVEFLYRAQAAGVGIALDCDATFLHPGSKSERHPILGGLFYAVVPRDPVKQMHQFRNRAYLFRAYRKRAYLVLEPIRYGWFFLVARRFDWRGFSRWAAASWTGFRARSPDCWCNAPARNAVPAAAIAAPPR